MRAFTALILFFACALAAGCGSKDADTVGNKPSEPEPKQASKGQLPPGSGDGGVNLTEVGSFEEPLYVTQPPGEKRDLFVVERAGTIRVLHDGGVEGTPFLDVADQVETGFNEQGLLSMAFAPDYRQSGLFYVYFTEKETGNISVVEYERAADDPLRADPDSARPLLGIPHSEFDNHNGGLLLFGPDDSLYIGVGDGGGGGDQDRRGQDLDTLLAKILRIDPRPQGGKPYGIPEDNPFVGRPGAMPEIFEYGLRNPWRFSFDRNTDDLLIGDVGQDEFEEVNYLPPGRASGANLGWSAFEGEARFNDDVEAPGAIPPILTYSRDRGCSITGGYVVRDRSLRSLYGRYVYGDFCAGDLRSFIPSGAAAEGDRELGLNVPGLSSFGEDSAGHVYATSLEGPLYRLDPAG